MNNDFQRGDKVLAADGRTYLVMRVEVRDEVVVKVSDGFGNFEYWLPIDLQRLS